LEFIEVKTVDEGILEEVVRRILKVVTPAKIVLFGSYAYGKPDEDSDLDILVVVDRITSTRRELRLKIRKALREYLLPKDILVVTTEDVERWKSVPDAFITSVMRKGRVLYEREN